MLRNPGTDREEVLPSKLALMAINAGEAVRIETAGGGGFGDPTQRPIELIAADLLNEIVTEEHARDGYGDTLVDRALTYMKDGRSRTAA